MSPSWAKRKSRLAALLQCESGDEDAEGLALDRILHGQSVIGKTGMVLAQVLTPTSLIVCSQDEGG